MNLKKKKEDVSSISDKTKKFADTISMEKAGGTPLTFQLLSEA
jgi:hypothetical protein